MTALVRHLHDFAREVRLTEAEWMAAIQWLNRTGQISDEKREEFILTSDVLGLSMLVVQMNHRLDPAATPATVLGPFHIEGSPELDYGERHVPGPARHAAVLHGTVTDLDGEPVAGAVLDLWQADNEGPTSRSMPTSTRPGCGPSTRRARTAATACAPSRRSATRSRWTGRSATSSRAPRSATSGRRTCTS